ncbi:AEC family transporter [Oceanobacter mangrovi]|uniref:AEC family transporter n=1 Tax=Oceanobacter mangrovi TaxID=2862510 RepID=UPI001C8D80E4|nr:AEC family transporter [Oceanobacter mangrovi]
MYLQSLVFTAEIILPVFLLAILGVVLRKRNMIDDHFVGVGSRLVFNLTLPVLVFLAISKIRFDSGTHLGLMGFVAASILIGWLFCIGWSYFFRVDNSDRSAFVQAAFRGNLGIVGIATVVYAFGEEGTRAGALVLAVGVPMYNLLSVVTLAQGQGVNWGGQMMLIAKNPLIIAIVAALPFSFFQWHLPTPIQNAATSLGQMTLPLALIGVGGSLDFQALRRANWVAVQISLLKLLILPGASVIAAWWLGFRGVDLGVIALMLASPTAAASFVMARAMGANHVLTANTIAVTTLASMVTMGGFFYVLSVMSLV